MENGDRGWRGLYQAGGIGMIAAGLLVLVTLPLIPTLIPSLAPATVQSGLESIQSQRLLFGTTWGLYLVSDLLYLIPFPALFVVLRQHSRAVALIALIFNSLFVTIDVGVDIPLRLSLIGLSNSYASANPVGQAAYVATAQLAMDLANITALIATFVQFAAVILVSYAMLRDTRCRAACPSPASRRFMPRHAASRHGRWLASSRSSWTNSRGNGCSRSGSARAATPCRFRKVEFA